MSNSDQRRTRRWLIEMASLHLIEIEKILNTLAKHMEEKQFNNKGEIMGLKIAELWISKNWHTVTDLEDVGNKWVAENCKKELDEYLKFSKDGVYSFFPADREVIKLDGIFQFND